MKGLKIGFVFDDSLDRGDGIQQYVKTVGEWLLDQGHDVKFLVGETKQGPFPGRTYSLSKNYSVQANGNRLSVPGPASKRRIQDILDKEQFDILHVQTPYNPLLAGRVIKLAPANLPIVGTFHISAEDKLTSLGARLVGSLQQASLRRLNRIVSVSEAAQNFAARNYQINSDIIPNATKIPELSNLPSKTKDNSIVFLGRLVERKGCRELLHAFALLRKTMDVTLTICSDGEQRPMLEQLTQRLGISDSVTFLGRVSEEEKYRQLAQAKLAVFPSLHGESFGIVLLEAMAVKNPVVLAGDNPGYRSVMAPQAEHLLINPRDTRAFAEHMQLLLTDESLRTSLLTWQQKHLPQFTIETVGPQLVDLYHQVIKEVTGA